MSDRRFGWYSEDNGSDAARVSHLYRTMSTADIASLFMVPESEIYNHVFGTRAASLREHKRTSNATAPTQTGERT